MSSCQKDGFFECLRLLTLEWTCSLPVNICLLKISTQKWLWLCAVRRLAFPPTPASARLFKHTCSIIWLRIPWQRTLALDLLTSFPDCDNHPLEPNMESNIMVICWGHCCELTLQQTSRGCINYCRCRLLKTEKSNMKVFFSKVLFSPLELLKDSTTWRQTWLSLQTPNFVCSHYPLVSQLAFVSSTKALSPVR